VVAQPVISAGDGTLVLVSTDVPAAAAVSRVLLIRAA
jgi:hypothetical protein